MRDNEHNPVPNMNAARLVAELTEVAESIGPQRAAPASAAQIAAQAKQAAAAVSAPTDNLEAAWQTWSKGIQKVDERGMSLLRAAFEAGWDAGRATP